MDMKGVTSTLNEHLRNTIAPLGIFGRSITLLMDLM
jgi:hypothetical protein